MIDLKLYTIIFILGVMVACNPTKIEIIGGRNTTIEEHPWMASVHFFNLDQTVFECSGFLISPSWVLTAGHCVDGSGTVNNYLIGVGSNYSTTHSAWINKTVRHPNYTATVDHNPLNDIALINLKRPVDSAVATPIGLPKLFAEVPQGSQVNITGWGLIDGRQSNGVLNTISLPLISLQSCIDAFKGDSLYINETFCVGNYGDNKGVCSGDSGGPAEFNGTAVGIASWTMYGCADNGFPSVFTNISYYRNWIYEVTNI